MGEIIIWLTHILVLLYFIVAIFFVSLDSQLICFSLTLFIIEKCWHKKQRGEFGLLCKIKITLVLSGFLAVLALPSSLSIKIPLLLNLLSRLRNHSEKHVKPPFPSSCWEEIHVQGEKKKKKQKKKSSPGPGRFMSHYHKTLCRSCHHLLYLWNYFFT